MLTHVDLLKAVAEEGKPTFISTGMSTYKEIDAAVKLFRNHDCPFVLMHCISEYPAQEKSLNLRCLQDGSIRIYSSGSGRGLAHRL